MMCNCDELFKDFKSGDLESLRPEGLPKNRGVYAIRIRGRGKPVNDVILSMEDFCRKTEWVPFSEYVLDRTTRLKNIGECPLVYIGAAPTSLRSRYSDLCGRRHTGFYPILALLMNGWRLDYEYFETEKPKQFEKSLKDRYEKIHKSLPALVKK